MKKKAKKNDSAAASAKKAVKKNAKKAVKKKGTRATVSPEVDSSSIVKKGPAGF